MDPNQTYLDMFQAMKEGDFETARELALTLKRWFANGGFYSYQYTPQAMHVYIASVLRRTSSHGPAPEFSLVCRLCDGGGDMESEEQAIAAGWSDIELALALRQANFCGLCPRCKSASRRLIAKVSCNRQPGRPAGDFRFLP